MTIRRALRAAPAVAGPASAAAAGSHALAALAPCGGASIAVNHDLNQLTVDAARVTAPSLTVDF